MASDARASVAALLSRASSYPCSAAPPAFSRIAAGSTSTFQLALDALLPALDPPAATNGNTNNINGNNLNNTSQNELTDRILVSFLLFALYAPHGIAINPFKGVLFGTFLRERDKAARLGSTGGGVAPNEPLVWVLWKILRGDGDDIGPYSPNALARSLLPPDFRAAKLTLDEGMYADAEDDADAPAYHPFTSGSARGTPAPTTGSPAPERTITPATDARAEAVAHGMRLFLAACGRVLSLAEQRHLTPILPLLAAPGAHTLYTTPELAALCAHNPNVAASLLSLLLAGSPASSAPVSDSDGAEGGANGAAAGRRKALSALIGLPPAPSSYGVFGHLLRDGSALGLVLSHPAFDSDGADIDTVSALVRTEALGAFVGACVDAFERAAAALEAGEGGGVEAEEYVRGVQHFSRFLLALLTLSILSPTASDGAETAAIARFSLANARIGEAREVYARLVGGR